MKADVRTTFRLLKPHAKEHAGVFALILLFGVLAAFGERSVFLFLTPTFAVLFPDGGVSAAMPGSLRGSPEIEPTFLSALIENIGVWRNSLMTMLLGNAHPVTDFERIEVLKRVGIVVVVVALFTGVTQYVFTWLSRKVALLIVVALRMRLARHLMGLSMGYHDSRKLGDVLSRISADVGQTLIILNDAARNLILEPLLGIVSLVLAFVAAPLPALAMLVLLPTVAIPVAVLSKKVRKGSSRSLTKLGASVQVLTQMFQGIRTVKAFRAEERELDRFHKINNEYVSSAMKMVRAVAQTNLWTVVLTHGGLGVLIVALGWFQIRGTGSFSQAGDMIAFFVLIANVYTNVKKTTRMWSRLQESVGASERLQELLDIPQDVKENDGAFKLQGLGSGLRLENLSFSYPEGDGAALSDINLEIKAGETLALVGASGSGKSTLIDILARFRDPSSGTISVDGHDLRDLTFDSWSSHFAMVGQSPFLFHATVEENIGYGRPGASKQEVMEAARTADIHGFIESLSEGYVTDVADMGSRLSGGQRQRITIARAILKGAPLLLLDEATSALDTETEVKVQAALEALAAGRTVVVIAHRLSTIRNADRIAVMDGGRIIEIGTHDDLLAAGGAYSSLHRAQFGKV